MRRGYVATPPAAVTRAAITSANPSNADASRNGAPGNFSGVCAPMK